MSRIKETSGVEAKPRFQPAEPSLKVLVHQAGVIEGYDKVIPHRSEPRDPLRSPADNAPKPPEPSLRRAGERFGPIELPESVAQRYDTKPLGTLPLSDMPPPAAPKAAISAVPRVRAPRPLLLGAALSASILLSAWGAVTLLQREPSEAAARPAYSASTGANALRARAPQPHPAPTAMGRGMPPDAGPFAKPQAAPPQAAPPRAAPPRARTPNVRVVVRPTPRAQPNDEQSTADATNARGQSSPSKEANDLMLGQW